MSLIEHVVRSCLTLLVSVLRPGIWLWKTLSKWVSKLETVLGGGAACLFLSYIPTLHWSQNWYQETFQVSSKWPGLEFPMCYNLFWLSHNHFRDSQEQRFLWNVIQKVYSWWILPRICPVLFLSPYQSFPFILELSLHFLSERSNNSFHSLSYLLSITWSLPVMSLALTLLLSSKSVFLATNQMSQPRGLYRHLHLNLPATETVMSQAVCSQRQVWVQPNME